MRHLYSAALYLLQPFFLLRMLWRSRLMPGYRQRLGERFGWVDAPAFDAPVIWLHAVSLGETQAAAPLVEALLRVHPDHAVVMTTTTPTGSERVRALFGPRVFNCYAPWDLPGAVGRFLRRVRPRLLVLMETELWPNTIHCCRVFGCSVILANARLSQRSASGYARFPALTRKMLQQLDVVACQSAEDGQRFIALGLPPASLEITGSLKFEITYSARQREEARRLRNAYRADSRPILLAASTHPGEEEAVLDAYARLRCEYDGCLLLLVPRHPERAAGVEKLCRRHGWRVQRRSQGYSPGADHDIVLGDMAGELALLQALASVVFVGGSLVPHGGHNPLEAAAWGVPLVCGPHMNNFSAITRQLVDAGAMIQVTPGELTTSLSGLLGDAVRRRAMGAAGQRVVAANRGALVRLLQLIDAQLAV
jgi:3-deoxy-D-manno-octulosonic-acid transferase